MAVNDQAVDPRRMFSFPVGKGGKFTGKHLPHLNHRKIGTCVLWNVLHFCGFSFL